MSVYITVCVREGVKMQVCGFLVYRFLSHQRKFSASCSFSVSNPDLARRPSHGGFSCTDLWLWA